jgi:hypothetical protein
MVLGLKYKNIERLMPPLQKRDRPHGLSHYDLFAVLYHYRKTLQYISRWDPLGKPVRGLHPVRKKWPPKPWAPAHLIQVPGHWMAMDENGRVFCPAGTYTQVPEKAQAVIGVFGV